MALRLTYTPYTLKFKFDAGTSRGVLKEKPTWFIRVFDESNPTKFGLGEAGPIEGLSLEDLTQMPFELERVSQKIQKHGILYDDQEIFELAQLIVNQEFPSIRFAVETALFDLKNGANRTIFDESFIQGDQRIPINGLIWMGDEGFMNDQKEEKLEKGFGCLKMKVAAIDFEKEIEILKDIRSRFSEDELILRIDANGGFENNLVLKKLDMLEGLGLHSIEQPIMPRQPEAMSLIVEKSPVPIALDEDLIGLHTASQRAELLDYIKPNHIVIKPSLVGGIKSTMDWIKDAESRKIGWWITSALESNIGLNAICQLTGLYSPMNHQGLGTGQLYHNNIESPLTVENGDIYYDTSKKWGVEDLVGVL